MKSFSRWLVTCVVCCAMVGLASSARAGFLAPFTGTIDFLVPNAIADGTVNYAVYEDIASGGTFATFLGDTTPGTFVITDGGPGLTGTYIYLYQVVNTDPGGGGESALDALNILFNSASALSVGYFSNAVFNEVAPFGRVGPTTNPRLDQPFATDELLSPSGFTGLQAPRVPTSGDIEPGKVEFGWTSPTVAATRFSTIVFITSNAAPIFVQAVLEDGGFTSSLLPAPIAAAAVPEPTTVAMALGAVPFGLCWLRRRREDRSAQRAS